MTDRLPLTEVGRDEALARITYQIILSDYAAHPDAYDTPSLALLLLSSEYRSAGIDDIAREMNLAGIWVGNGGTIAGWLRSRIVVTVGRATKLARPGRSRNR